MKVLAIDFGLKRIGVAVGSPDTGLAFTREVLLNDERLFKHLERLIQEDHIELVLIGMPYKRDTEPGDITQELERFAQELQKRFSLPMEYFDERYTTKMAQEKLNDLQLKKSQRQEPIDSLAAQILLQEWLERD